MTIRKPTSKPINITYHALKHDAMYLYNLILNSGKEYNAILIVGRGGLHLGYYLAKLLGIYHIQCLGIKRIGKKKGYEIHSGVQMGPDYNYLVIDDIVNTGQTLSMIAEAFSEEAQYDFVCQIERSKHKITTDRQLYSARRYKENTTIDFYYNEN